MTPRLDDTIVAVASARGPAARGIVRISGSSAPRVVEAVFRPDDPERWRAAQVPLRHAGRIRLDGVDLPLAVHLWPSARSYTGQPMAELHMVGSPPLLDLVVQRLCDHGARPAGRGEFTLRAFLGGRMDLLRAEAVLGVIDADDPVELERALGQLAGGVSTPMQRVRDDLLDLLADLEAGLDFVDEDIEFVSSEAVVRRLDEAERFAADLLERSTGRFRTTGRRVVVLAGLPNAGKSTLFNRLAGADRALVSAVAGTTRDWLVAEVALAGTPVELIDTAGWEWEPQAISAEAKRLRHGQLERADLVVWCTAADLDAEQRVLDDRLRGESPGAVLWVGTKADSATGSFGPGVVTSTEGGTDDGDLVAAVHAQLSSSAAGRDELLATTSARCRESLRGAREALDRAREAATCGAGDELVALETRAALDHLGAILGVVYTDDVLDRVFSKFCIGK